MIRYSDNSKQFIRNLKLAAGDMQESAAAAINRGIDKMADDYRRSLKQEMILRNAFTLGAIKVYKATARRSSGELRQLAKINAILGVRKMKGGRDHYLLAQEEGKVKAGNAATEGRVPIPLTPARTGESPRKPVARPYRLNTARPQQLQFDGRQIGTPNDGWNAKGGAQRWAILHKYADKGVFDLSKPFIFTGAKRGMGVFVERKGRVSMIRTLEKSSVRVKARHLFERSGKGITPVLVQNYFLHELKKRIKK